MKVEEFQAAKAKVEKYEQLERVIEELEDIVDNMPNGHAYLTKALIDLYPSDTNRALIELARTAIQKLRKEMKEL